MRILPHDLVRSGFVRTKDRVHLYWRVVGHGPVLACCNGIGLSTFFWKYVVAQFSDRYSVVVWDYRGHGRSEQGLESAKVDFGISRHAEDLGLVLDAVGPSSSPALVLGQGVGCQVALEFWHQNPEAVGGLVLINGTAGHVLDASSGHRVVSKLLPLVRRLAGAGGDPLIQLAQAVIFQMLSMGLRARAAKGAAAGGAAETLNQYLDQLARIDHGTILACLSEAQLHSAWTYLPEVDVPTLVIAAENDVIISPTCGARIAALVPDAELFLLEAASHSALVERPLEIGQRLEQFILEHGPFAREIDAPIDKAPKATTLTTRARRGA